MRMFSDGTGSMNIGTVRTVKILDTARSFKKEYSFIMQIALLGGVAFSVSGAEFMSLFFPCGTAFVSAAIRRNTLNLYMIVPVILSYVLTISGNTGFSLVLSDAVALILCTVCSMAISRKNVSDFARMAGCGLITTLCSLIYYIATDSIYRISIPLLFLELVTVMGLYYAFHVFLSLVSRDLSFKSTPESGVASLSIVFALAFAGLFSGSSIGMYEPDITCTFVLFFILVMGYKLGIYAGITSGAVSAAVLLLTGIIYSSQVIILICAGITAGLFKGLSKYTTSVCFAATCMIFNLSFVGSLGSFAILPPLAASLMFSAMPRSLSNEVTRILRKLVHDESKVCDLRTDDIIEVLENYRNCYAKLGSLYSLGLDKRSIVSHQFKGLENVVEKLKEEIRASEKGGISKLSSIVNSRYRIESQVSGYARDGGISGDSYITKRISGNRYLMILCDGMGKGEAASLESSLAVKTISNLIDAGFETELALHTLNSILLLKSKEEVFSTVDIGILDCDKAVLKLYKVGAASTFIKRGNRVDAVKMATLPMGIVDGFKVDYVSIKVHEGDQIVMVSDGVTDSGRYAGRDEGWISELISGVKSKDPGTMADLIVSSAIENYGVRERDDITVISACVLAR